MEEMNCKWILNGKCNLKYYESRNDTNQIMGYYGKDIIGNNYVICQNCKGE